MLWRARLARMELRRSGRLHRSCDASIRLRPARIHPHDTKTIIRAVEIWPPEPRARAELFLEGRQAARGFRTLRLVLDPQRTALQRAICARTRTYVAAGW